MIEWLLKEEEKNKVGRPRLASEKRKKIATVMAISGILIVIVLSINFISMIKGKSFVEIVNSIPIKALKSVVKNKNGFVVTKKYTYSTYEMTILTDNVSNYSGNYKYTLYKLSKGKYKEIKSETFDNSYEKFNVVIDRIVNKNENYKIKLEILNGSSINDSFAPVGWQYVNSNKNNKVYAYYIFTVKAKYNPITRNEIKESKKKKNKIFVRTSDNNPRKFIIDCKDVICDITVFYTGNDGKKTQLISKENKTNEIIFAVPSVYKTSLVTVNIKSQEDLKKLKLSNWKLKKDKNKINYITNSYLLKPESAY